MTPKPGDRVTDGFDTGTFIEEVSVHFGGGPLDCYRVRVEDGKEVFFLKHNVRSQGESNVRRAID